MKKNNSLIFISILCFSIFSCNTNTIYDGYESDPFEKEVSTPSIQRDIPYEGLDRAIILKNFDDSLYETLMDEIESYEPTSDQTDGRGITSLGLDVLKWGSKIVVDFVKDKAKSYVKSELNNIWSKVFDDNTKETKKIDVTLNQLETIQKQLTELTETLKIQNLEADFKKHRDMIKEISIHNKLYWNKIRGITDSTTLTEEEKSTQINNQILEWGNKDVSGTSGAERAVYILTILSEPVKPEISLGSGQKSQAPQYLPDLYDELAFKKHPWEHLGYDFRQVNREADISIATQCYFLASMYFSLTMVSDKDSYNMDELSTNFTEIQNIYNTHDFTLTIPACYKKEGFTDFQRARVIGKPDILKSSEVMVCQIKGLEGKIFNKYLGYEDFSYAFGNAKGYPFEGHIPDEKKRIAERAIFNNVAINFYYDFIRSVSDKSFYAPSKDYQIIFDYYKSSSIKTVLQAIDAAGFKRSNNSGYYPKKITDGTIRFLYREGYVTFCNKSKSLLSDPDVSELFLRISSINGGANSAGIDTEWKYTWLQGVYGGNENWWDLIEMEMDNGRSKYTVPAFVFTGKYIPPPDLFFYLIECNDTNGNYCK